MTLSPLAQLHRAVALRQGDKVRSWLGAGCRADALHAQGRSALHVAADANHADMLEILLAQPGAGAGINARDACDMTALHIAASRPRGAACARLLIAAGADVNAPGPFGVRPLLCASNYGYGRTRVLLQRHGATPARGALSELSMRSTLAHLFGIGGETVLHGRRISLESAYPEGTFGLLGEAVAACAKTRVGPDGTRRRDGDRLEAAATALLRAGENIGVPAQTLHARILQGETVILPTGLPCHCTACVWVAGRVLWCDRLMQPSVVAVPAYARMPAKSQVAWLRRLQKSGTTWLARAVVRMAAMHLQARACRLVPDGTPGCTPKRQHVGNCAMASAKAALWAVLGARTLHDAAGHRKLYKVATTYARFHHLRAYVQHHRQATDAPPDAALVASCTAKLLAPKRRAYLPPEALLQIYGWRV